MNKSNSPMSKENEGAIPKTKANAHEKKKGVLRHGRTVGQYKYKGKKSYPNLVLSDSDTEVANEKLLKAPAQRQKSTRIARKKLQNEIAKELKPENQPPIEMLDIVNTMKEIFQNELRRQSETFEDKLSNQTRIFEKNIDLKLQFQSENLKDDIKMIGENVERQTETLKGEIKRVSDDIHRINERVGGLQKQNEENVKHYTDRFEDMTVSITELKKQINYNDKETSEKFEEVKGKIQELDLEGGEVTNRIKGVLVEVEGIRGEIEGSKREVEGVKGIVEEVKMVIEGVKDESSKNSALVLEVENTLNARIWEIVQNFDYRVHLDTMDLNNPPTLDPYVQEFQPKWASTNVKGNREHTKIHGGSTRIKKGNRGSFHDSDYDSGSRGGSRYHSDSSSHSSRGSHDSQHRRHTHNYRHDYIKDKPQFDGENKPVPNFITEVEEYKKLNNLSSRKLLEMFHTFMIGRAKDWWDLIKKKVNYWYQVKNMLYKHYFNKFELDKLKKRWYKLSYNEGDDVELFALEAIKLRKLMNPREDIKEKCERIIMKLPEQIRNYLLCQKIEDEEVLLANIKEAMRLRGDEGQPNQKGSYNDYKFNKFKNNYSQPSGINYVPPNTQNYNDLYKYNLNGGFTYVPPQMQMYNFPQGSGTQPPNPYYVPNTPNQNVNANISTNPGSTFESE